MYVVFLYINKTRHFQSTRYSWLHC